MAYRELSEQIRQLDNPQRSDPFIRQFRDAVRTGEIEAADIPGRFTMPKEFRRRGAEGSYQREAREMIFEVTPAFERWFEQTNQNLAAAPTRQGKVKVSIEAVEAGELDFAALAAETHRKMQASFEKGQNLGKSRSQAAKGTKTTGTRKSTRRK